MLPGSPFETWPLLGGPTAQTLLGAVPRRGLRAFARGAQDRWFEVSGSGRLLARVHLAGPQRPLAVILPGLTGDSESVYALGLARHLYVNGFDTLRLNFRGALGTEAVAGGLHHAARSNDVLDVLQQLAPSTQSLYVIGYSLGGSVALRLAGVSSGNLPGNLRALAVVSPPLDLAACAERLLHGHLNRWLTRRFLRSFALTLARQPLPPLAGVQPAEVLKLPSVLAFDRLFTAPAAGYPSVEAYYTDASPLTWIHRAELPGLILHALDDPLVDPAGVRDPRLLARPNIQVEALHRGGHVGFVGRRRSDGPRHYAETRILAFLRGLEAGQKG
jgi:uncharacterized protein